MAPLCGDNKNFFVSYVAPFKSVTARTLARWMKDILSSSGVDTSLWDPHSTRAAVVTHKRSAKNLSLGQICRLADWSQTSAMPALFDRYFYIYLQPYSLYFCCQVPPCINQTNKSFVLFSFCFLFGTQLQKIPKLFRT